MVLSECGDSAVTVKGESEEDHEEGRRDRVQYQYQYHINPHLAFQTDL
jgi:hypothetical protein